MPDLREGAHALQSANGTRGAARATGEAGVTIDHGYWRQGDCVCGADGGAGCALSRPLMSLIQAACARVGGREVADLPNSGDDFVNDWGHGERPVSALVNRFSAHSRPDRRVCRARVSASHAGDTCRRSWG